MKEDITKSVLSQITEQGVTDLLASLVKRSSVVGTPSECPQFVANKLREIGMRVETYNLEDFRTGTVVIGYLDGAKEQPCLMLEGHWDTDPFDASRWTHSPLGGEVHNGYIYGRGVVDSKGSLAAMIAAVEAIQKAGIKLKGSLIVLSIGDGESAFRGAHLAVDAGIADRVDWVIGGEATNLQTIDVAISGLVVFKLDVLGKASHPAQPQYGINAIYKMNKVLAGIEQGKVKFSYEPYKYFPDFPRIHVNAVRTQPKGFEVPDQCSAVIQVLTVPGMTPQSTLQDIQLYIEELKKKDKELDCRLTILPRGWYFWLPPCEAPAEDPIVKSLQNVTKLVTGTEPRLAGFYGVYSAGAAVTTRASRGDLFGKPRAVVFGPGDFRMAHTADERLATKQLTECAKVYASAALELLS